MNPDEVASAAAAFQIVFSDTSASELAQLPKSTQLEILETFNLTAAQLEDRERFGTLTREGRTLYRYRLGDLRIYFERAAQGIVIQRILNKNSLTDFLFRSNLPVSEDEQLQKSPEFWKLIDDRS